MGKEAPALYFLKVANPDREVAAPRAFLSRRWLRRPAFETRVLSAGF
jgi:hypothetical protein